MSALLDGALEQAKEARAAYLEAACGGDLALRLEVEELLLAEAAADDFLAVPAVERAAPLIATLADEPAESEPDVRGRVLGAYRLLEELGEGGMGTVYLAERADGQFEQQVALKLLKHGLPGETWQRRFLQERQILARLSHPAIARLLDGGVTPQGMPFFVMERVVGRPVTEYCREHGLGVPQRLLIFLEICDAAQYAHRNLVVHRDLKPSNILVDPAGHVKLLDFGIAKLLGEGQGSEAPESTRTLVRAFTPEYAAPEQLLGEPVTTATDVYSLGVLLYELLTGERPHRRTRSGAGLLEQAALDQEPSRPSSRAASRELARRLRGDLDWIVLKALQREPERRYASAEALAGDVRRHLEGQPVTARRDTLRYRAAKFLRRHRLAATAALVVLLSLLVGLVGTAWQARRAEREANKADAVKDFMKSLFSASDPSEAQGRERTARELLDDGARRIETELRDQPEVQSEVARLIANTYQQLGEYERALPLLRADLERRRRLDGPRSVAVAESLTALADVVYDQGRYQDAGPLYEEALAIQRGRGGGRTPEVAALLWDLGGVSRNRDDLERAEALDEQALALFVEAKGAGSQEATWVRESLAIAYSQGGQIARAASTQAAVAAWREAHDGLDHPQTLNARYNLGTYLLRLGRFEEAGAILDDVVARQRRVLGARHDRLAAALRSLARVRHDQGDDEAALPFVVEALSIHRERFGPGDRQVAFDLAWQAAVESRTRRLADAEHHAREAVHTLESASDVAASDLAAVRTEMAGVLAEAGHDAEAERLLTQSVEACRARQPREELCLAYALDALGDVTRRAGRTTQAAALGHEAVEIIDRSDCRDHPAAALARVRAGAALWADGNALAGEPLLRVGLGSLERLYPGGHFQLAAARSLLGEALARGGRPGEARPLLMDALAWREARLGASDRRTAAVRQALALLERADSPSRETPALR